MVNSDDFIKRLEIILEYYNLTASSFADKIGVQRSSMSHLLSGRNKPSLDFILKITDIFPEVDLYWILNGTGGFPKYSEPIKNLKSNIEDSTSIDLFSQVASPSKNESIEESVQQTITALKNGNSDEIEKIVFFYKNGTFKSYNPNS